MTSYSVPIVRPNLRLLWHERWDNAAPTRRARHADRDGSLGQSVVIEANNASEAAEKAERQRPGYVAIRDAIQRHP